MKELKYIIEQKVELDSLCQSLKQVLKNQAGQCLQNIQLQRELDCIQDDSPQVNE